MSVRDAFAVVGTIVGAYFGNPQLGYAIGSAIGGAVDPEIIKGPTLGDLAKQTSMEGVPRPIIWALSPPMSGNIIASSEPKIVRKRKRQGKGGPKVETEHVYRTYAIGVCEGPITRFVRIWRNNTLVYDVSEFPLKTHEENVEFMTHARFFLGAWDQAPSPAMEKIFGVGTTPAHRGTAYLVMDDEELTDLRGAIPQWMFQVERCEGFFVTSRPYSLEAIDAMTASALGDSGMIVEKVDDAMDVTLEALGGALYGDLVTYVTEDEALDIGVEALGGDFYGGLVTYDDGEPEGLDMGVEALGGTFYGDLVEYNNYPPEGFDIGLTALGGTLT